MSNFKKLMMTTAGGAALNVEDVFSTYLYEGNGSTQTITNGIDLDGEGGLVWLKNRDEGNASAWSNFLFDTERGATKNVRADSGGSEETYANSLTAFNSDGFSLGDLFNTNGNGYNFASWTFRKAPRFFDVVTYTGTGSVRTVSHNLGVAPGCIMVKRTDTFSDWQVYHRSNTASPETDYLVLNSTAATVDSNTRWNDTAPTDSVFTVGTEARVNASGGTYVAYLFAHNDGDGEFGPNGDADIIKCGGFTDSSSGWSVDLGFEPQFLLTKPATFVSGNWEIVDTMRGFTADRSYTRLYPNLTNAEQTVTKVGVNSTGFFSPTAYVSQGVTIIYIAIRRGPMRVPESGADVFALDTQNSGSYSSPPYYRSGFVTDAAMRLYRTGGSSSYPWFASRMTGPTNLVTSSNAAQVTNASTNDWDYMEGWGGSGASSITTVLVSPMFRRAPGFFDVVAYQGTSGTATKPHNLGVVPEMMIFKNRNDTDPWPVYHSATGSGGYIPLNLTSGYLTSSLAFNNTAPTDSVFTVGSTLNFSSSFNYIAYLFATLDGVSKVGSYTGNGTSQTIDCGFTSGARFILIKRSTGGDWYVWDATRGIVTGNDPHLSLNSTAAEVTTDDSVDPDSSGFIVNQVAATNINVSSASYIFYAIA